MFDFLGKKADLALKQIDHINDDLAALRGQLDAQKVMVGCATVALPPGELNPLLKALKEALGRRFELSAKSVPEKYRDTYCNQFSFTIMSLVDAVDKTIADLNKKI